MGEQQAIVTDGGYVRDSAGRFLQKPKQAYVITAENATDLVNRRWNMYRRAAAEGAKRATKRDSTALAYSDIVEVQAERALDPKDPRGVEAARFVRDAIDANKPADSPQSGARVTIELSQDALMALAGALAGVRER